MKKILSCLEQRFAAYQNDRAFTLVEMLFAFSVFLIIVFFISPIFQLILHNHDLQERLQDMEWDVFCSQIKKEIRMSTNAQVVNQTLVLSEGTDKVTYEQYEHSIRRRVNDTGHEIILQDVSQVIFTRLNNAVMVSVKDLNGKDYSVIVYSFLEWSGTG